MEITSEIIEKVISMYPKKVKEYLDGKTGLLGLFVGEIMKLSKGKADVKLAHYLVKLRLEKGVSILTKEEVENARVKVYAYSL